MLPVLSEEREFKAVRRRAPMKDELNPNRRTRDSGIAGIGLLVEFFDKT
jgi:hypothetical protein